jgi:hypothetical protein
MKFSSMAVAALLWITQLVAADTSPTAVGQESVSVQDDCPFVELATPIELDLSNIDSLMFVGVIPTVVSRVVGPPMVKILRHTNNSPRMLMEGTMAMIGKADCITDDTVMTMTPSMAPTMAPSSASSYYVNVASFLGMTAGSYLTGVSPAASLGLGLAATAGAWMPGAHVSISILSLPVEINRIRGSFLTIRFHAPQAQEVVCEDLMEIEIHGPPLMDGSEAIIASLEETIANLTAQVAGFEGYLSEEEVDQLLIDTMVDEIAFDDYIAATLPQDVSLTHLTNRGRSKRYDAAGFPIIEEYSPEPSFYLRNAHHDSLLRDMQGDVFQFPESGNLPEDVTFALPDPPAYAVPSDLYYLTILELASLLRSGAVDCTTLVQAFIDRVDEFDPFLAIVVTPLYEKALAMAEEHQALLDAGTDLGPLMCIPFGVKDHHQVFDDDPTTYGNILYSANIHKTKSVLMEKIMSYGAIPIAKTVLGTFASGSGKSSAECKGGSRALPRSLGRLQLTSMLNINFLVLASSSLPPHSAVLSSIFLSKQFMAGEIVCRLTSMVKAVVLRVDREVEPLSEPFPLPSRKRPTALSRVLLTRVSFRDTFHPMVPLPVRVPVSWPPRWTTLAFTLGTFPTLESSLTTCVLDQMPATATRSPFRTLILPM